MMPRRARRPVAKPRARRSPRKPGLAPVAQSPDNFLALDDLSSDYASARFVILPIPYDATTSYSPGTRDGPRAIITASQQVELYDEGLGRDSTAQGIATLPPLTPVLTSPDAMMKQVYRAARPIMTAGKFLFILGGEHSITAPAVQAVAERYKKLSVLQIDAHADLRASYQGSPCSHASVMRRIHDQGVACVAVGIRNYSREEADFIARSKSLVLSTRDCEDNPDWIGRAVAGLSDAVYVTIDIDGFDPAFAPGTGTPEPGGLNWRQVTDLLAAVARARRIVAADVVEVRPIPPNQVTEFLAARLCYRIIGLA